MPIGPESKEAEEMEAEGDSAAEMNGEEDESEEDHTGSQSDTEEESSEMDDEDCERRRAECLDEMSDLEKQFSELKEKLFKERLQQVRAKLEEVGAGKAAEYLDPLAVLQKNMQIRIEVAGIYQGLCLEVIKNRYDCELQGAKQHLESEKLLLYDNMHSQLLERIQRLEEDRQSIDITSEWWDDELRTKRNRKKWDPFKPEKKKKPPLISGPYIVYMLSDLDILEDWTAIKKVGESVTKHVCCPLKPCRRVSSGCESPYQAKVAVSPQKRKSDGGIKTDKQQFSARCEDGQLHYEGESFCKGQNIVLEIKDEAPSHPGAAAAAASLRRGGGGDTPSLPLHSPFTPPRAMDPLEEADAQCRAALPTPSPHRVSNDPVYDYPDSCSPRWPVQRVSLKHVRVLDRLLLTQVVWLQLTVNSATALHILQREPPGTFLVRKSNTNQRKVLCVRLSNACGPSFVHHVYIREEPSGLSLDGSALTFPDLFRLISSYCGTRDILPHVLRLPEAIDKATSHKQLEAISHLGVEFWNSSLNTREWASGEKEPKCPDLTAIDLSDCPTPQALTFGHSCLIKTRSPIELDCLAANGALCFFNPLFLEEWATEGQLKRSQFKRSIKVRVSTETSSPLSPPPNPPPPIPAEALNRQRPGTVQAPRRASEDQEYKQPKMSLRARLRKKLSKGSFDIGLMGVLTLAPTREEEDYQVPRSGKTPQVQSAAEAEECKENSKERPGDVETMVPCRSSDTDTLEFDSKRLPSLKELDSSSLSSLDEADLDGCHKHSSPRLQRKSTQMSRRAKTPFRTVSEVFLSFLPPERKVLRAVEELAQDRSTTFGCLVQDFLTLVRERRKVPEPCKATLQAIRQFMSQMKNCLLEGSELNLSLQTMLPEADQDGVMEKAMYRCVLKPLKRHLEARLKRSFTEDGSLKQLRENLLLVRQTGPQAFEIRAGLPGPQEVEKIRHKLVKMQKAYSPTDKVIILLQACKLMYNSMTANPDELYGADDFLPLMSYVLALCDLPELLLEVEYMMELLDPALLMGEGGYYLTSLYASLAMLSGYHELKLEKTEFSVEFKKSLTHWHRRRADLPSFSDFQNFLRIGYQDPSNGCTSKTLVVRPSDTVETLCQLCAQKFKLTSQEGYGIFLYQGGKYQRLALDVRPQEIKAVLQSQEASFYFVYRRGEEEEEEEEAAGGKHRTEEEKEEEIGDPSGTQRLLRRHAVDVEDGS